MDYPKVLYPNNYLDYKSKDPTFEMINGVKREEPRELTAVGWILIAIGLAWFVLILGGVFRGFVIELILGIDEVSNELMYILVFSVYCITLFLIKKNKDKKLIEDIQLLETMD